jgi:hypothetical protein
MKLILTFLALTSAMSAVAQDKWYYNKYQVNDLADLTPELYDLAIKDSRDVILGSLVVTGCGVGIYFLGKSTVKNGLDEDATFLEELLGNEVVGYGTIGLGIAAAAGGIIGSVVGLTRIGMIRKSGRHASAPYGNLSIFPLMIIDQNNSLECTGIALQISF